MRAAFLHALVVATLACGSDPAPAPPADATPDAADPCAGVSCIQGVCSNGRCILAPLDAGNDVAAEVGVDAAPDAAADGPVDAAPDGDPRCSPASLVYCEPVSPGCWNLATSNGMVPARNCGACGRACPSTAPECVAGRCTELAADAGRD